MKNYRSSRVPTTDDWCPTYSDGTVKISIHGDGTPVCGICYRVCAQGEDDLLLVRDFHENVEQEANALYEKIKKMKDVQIDHLLSIGFVFE